MFSKYKNEQTIIEIECNIATLKESIRVQICNGKINNPNQADYSGILLGTIGYNARTLLPERIGDSINSIIKDLEEEKELVEMYTKKGIGYEIITVDNPEEDDCWEGT